MLNEKLHNPTRKVIVCFSDGESWEEMNGGIELITLNDSGIRSVYHDGDKPRHLKEDQFTSYSLKRVFDRFISGDKDLTDFF